MCSATFPIMIVPHKNKKLSKDKNTTELQNTRATVLLSLYLETPIYINTSNFQTSLVHASETVPHGVKKPTLKMYPIALTETGD